MDAATTDFICEPTFVTGLEGLLGCVEHEMNTPLAVALSSIRTMGLAASKLQDPQVGEDHVKVARCLKTLKSAESAATEALERMEAVVSRLRDLVAAPNPETVRPMSLLRCVRRAIGRVEDATGESLRIRVEAQADRTIIGSPRRLEQLFVDLLRNAVGASEPAANIEVEIRDGDRQVEIVVRDVGQGIEADLLAALFEPKVRLRGPRVGSSLGLAIAKRVVEGHGGELTVDSEPGQGTQVELRLPLGPSDVSSMLSPARLASGAAPACGRGSPACSRRGHEAACARPNVAPSTRPDR